MNHKSILAADHSAHLVKSIRRIARAIDMRSKRVARDTGLTIPQIVVLQAIRELGDVTTATIARHVDLSPATAVTILDKLESRNFVVRTRSIIDRRIVHSSLTRAGKRTLAEAPPLLDTRFLARLSALPARERGAIVDAFETVAGLLDPAETGESAGTAGIWDNPPGLSRTRPSESRTTPPSSARPQPR